MTQRWQFLAVMALLAITAGCHSAIEEPCQKACDKPFGMAAAEANEAISVWRGLPEPQRTQAIAAQAAWAKRLSAQRERYLAQCTASCVAAGDSASVSCRRRAQSLAAWRRCGGAP